MEAGEDFVFFLRDGKRCYISPAMRSEPNVVDGYLVKEMGSKIKRAFNKNLKRFLIIDFKKQQVRFKKTREDVQCKE